MCNLKKWIGIFGFLFVLMFLYVSPVQAASYKTFDIYNLQQVQKVGNTRFQFVNGKIYTNKNGKKTALELITDSSVLGRCIVTNGNRIYYTTCKVYYDHAYSEGALYQIKSDGTSKKKLLIVRIDSDGPVFDLAGYYGGKLYYIQSPEETEINCPFYSYRLKSKKVKKVVKKNSGIVNQYGKYFIMSPATGDIGPLPFTIYNAKTGKVNVFTKRGNIYYYRKNRIYYSEFKNVSGPLYNFVIKKMNMNGKNVKVLAKISSASSISELTDKYVKYSDAEWVEHVKKF